jgi:hypothetical protein
MPEFSFSAGVSTTLAPPTSLIALCGMRYRVGVADVGVPYADHPEPC